MTFDILPLLTAAASFVHSHISAISVATAIVLLGTLLGDGLDLALIGLAQGWKKLLSLNVVLAALGADSANTTALGVAIPAFLLVLGGGGKLRDAVLAALLAIGTVNVGYLVGADRAKIALLFSKLFGGKA